MVQRKRIDWLTSNRQLEPFAASDFFEIVFLFVFCIEDFLVYACVHLYLAWSTVYWQVRPPRSSHTQVDSPFLSLSFPLFLFLKGKVDTARLDRSRQLGICGHLQSPVLRFTTWLQNDEEAKLTNNNIWIVSKILCNSMTNWVCPGNQKQIRHGKFNHHNGFSFLRSNREISPPRENMLIFRTSPAFSIAVGQGGLPRVIWIGV